MPQAILVQLDTAWEDGPTNRRRIREQLGRVTVEPGSMIVLPEMSTSGFSMNVRAIAEDDDRANERFFSELAREHESWLLAGIVRVDERGHGLNQAVAFDPAGEVAARYTKLFPFTYAGESDHYQRGEEIVTFVWHGMIVAPFICFDVRFPEVFRGAAAAGADVFPVIANFPAARQAHWTCLTRARAIENQAYVLAVNRAGRDPNVAYAGGSCVIDPWGETVSEAESQECALVADINPEVIRACRERFPVLADMRGEFIAAPGAAGDRSG